MSGKQLCCNNPIHELGIAGRAVCMGEPAGGGVRIMGLPIGLFGYPMFLSGRLVLVADESANAADWKD
jgi:hypothetical protein